MGFSTHHGLDLGGCPVHGCQGFQSPAGIHGVFYAVRHRPWTRSMIAPSFSPRRGFMGFSTQQDLDGPAGRHPGFSPRRGFMGFSTNWKWFGEAPRDWVSVPGGDSWGFLRPARPGRHVQVQRFSPRRGFMGFSTDREGERDAPGRL